MVIINIMAYAVLFMHMQLVIITVHYDYNLYIIQCVSKTRKL